MGPMLLKGGTLLELDPPTAEVADLRLDAGSIVERGSDLRIGFGEQLVELGGRLVLPGLVNAHTHLYATLARGMPAPVGRGLQERLRQVVWRYDRALDADAVYQAALIGAIESALAGTTTIVDHHSSPEAIEGSLDLIADACRRVGVRVVACYEVTDRNGVEGRVAGLLESRRFLGRRNDRVAGLAGAHAVSTLEDATLTDLQTTGEQTGAGIHLHLAEDSADDADAQARGCTDAVERLDRAGLLDRNAVLAHGAHLSAAALATVRERGAWLVHAPRSNMRSGVGYAPWVGDGHRRSALGTDGVGGDMLAEARACWFKARDAGLSDFAPQDALRLLAGSQRLASGVLGAGLGQLQPGGAADLVVLDYPWPTSLNAANFADHVLYGLASRHVSSVIVGGRIIVERRRIPHLDLRAIYAEARRAADRLWTAFERGPEGS